MKFISAFLLAAAVSTSALAAPATYKLDPTHSFPRFSYNHLGFSTQLSRFNKMTGTVTYDPEAHTGSVDVTIAMDSVDTGSTALNEHLQKPDFFDSAKYPDATFKSTEVKFDGDKPVEVDGTLTVKGISKPVKLTVTSFTHKAHPMLKKDAIGANATTVIKRSEFGLGLYAPAVGDDVTLDISLEAIKQ